ncbi:rifamycin-inactivating phosphotransferase [Amycolatopsis taiwanensis]|uniref:Rifampicin phosphotransferase n=1 Tax=Amycolatopsis taiwanensis TaxID=342230 RepID=A0A9W6R8F2_9PSEU|nr:rifamycin-inactivating phosphotransferase [Amycolatopsis taiwanensis]GLY71261.1 putative phosphoenolpyruvate synthase [Amycolatopsis taiwanensis]
MSAYVLGFDGIDKTQLPLVGGKGANLGELHRIDGVRVPGGFCVTTAAYRAVVTGDDAVSRLIDGLSGLRADDRDGIAEAAARLRAAIENLVIPGEIERAIIEHLGFIGEDVSCAVRSSATAEDLPSSSFAGQQDTYLNIRGPAEIVHNVRRCWASLFTDRAVAYRIQFGFDHRAVQLSVVVQRMVFPEVAGIMFTADPITGNRKVVSVDAGFGLGEAFVSGVVNADTYRARAGVIVDKKVRAQTMELRAAPDGTIDELPIAPERQTAQALSDEQILELEKLGRRIEAHFGRPQDIEWGLSEGRYYVLQSRPITTLYPVPRASDDKNHVYMSYGHRQMMTDAFKPLGLSFFQLLDEKLGRPAMNIAGGRFYKDMSHELTSPMARAITLKSLGQVDVLTANALREVLEHKEFARGLARGKASVMNFGKGGPLPMARQYLALSRDDDPGVVPELIAQNERSIEKLERDIATKSGEELFDFIIEDHRELTDIMFEPRSVAAAFVGIQSANWINKHLKSWLGEKNAADVLAQSADHNVVAAMGLDLLDVADVARQYPDIVEYLATAERDTFFLGLAQLAGGDDVSSAIKEYLRKYGMHCSGDIDFTRTRWSEDPTLLVPLILGNINNFPPGASRARVEKGRADAERAKADLLARLKSLPGGKHKAKSAEKRINLLRHFIGYREYSKHACLQRYGLYKQALMAEAGKLVDRGLIKVPEDVYFLSLEEYREVVRTGQLDYSVITERQNDFEVYQNLTPPRVITSEGEIFSGEYDAGDVPEGALAGVAVSAGVVEGRARVVLDLANADVQEGDILVAVFTDPSWSALFVSVSGVVMEVGGVMTHGAVIAREYGLPSVVGVQDATKRIRDGQLIRVNGTEGYVELLPEP